jgi:hypothetical protein
MFKSTIMLIDKTLSTHPFSDNGVDLLRLLPQQPVRSIDSVLCQVRNVLAHFSDQLVGNNEVAQSPNEQGRTLDIDTSLDAQKGLVSLVVRRAVAVVVACKWTVSSGYSTSRDLKH